MNFFVDESGDFGFGPKSPTQHIVVGCIKILKSKPIKKAVYKWEKDLVNMGWYPDKEIKWATALTHQRIDILKRLALLSFEFRCVYINKANISTFLHSKENVLYGYMATELLYSLLEDYTPNHIFLDEKTKLSHNYFEYYLRIKTHCEIRRDVMLHVHAARSTDVYCIRAVDFITGAIRHSLDSKKNIFVDIIKDRITKCRELFKK